ncbi:MAG: tetratricopeptide repeat protein [Selenomonadaceae bacterium]|nr:tetratricopeptide repeat protein [Selenomonadaceae bacterium]
MKNKLKLMAIGTICAVLCAFPITVSAAVQTFTATDGYTMSDYDNPNIAEQRAIDYAMRRAAEQAGVYIETYSRSMNAQISEDEVKTIASNKIKLVNKKLSRTLLSEGDIRITAEVIAEVDTADIDAILREEEKKRQEEVSRYRYLQARIAQQDEDLAALKKKIASLPHGYDDEDIREAQEREDRIFKADDMVKRADSVPIKAYDSLDMYKDALRSMYKDALRLNPKNDEAIIAYAFIDTFNFNFSFPSDNEFEQCFKASRKAVIVNPTPFAYYEYCTNVRSILVGQEVDLAPNEEYLHNLNTKYLETLNNAIRHTSRYTDDVYLAELYHERANFYRAGGILDQIDTRHRREFNLDKALADYTKAIEIKPDYASSYGWRAGFYQHGNQYDKALADYNKAIEFEPNNSFWYEQRANLYKENKQYDKALADYDKAIQIFPNNIEAQQGRQLVLKMMGKQG